MKNKNLLIAVFCNLILGSLLGADVLGINLYVKTLLVNLVMFVVPGMGWMGLLRRQVTSGVSFAFFQFVLSAALLILLHLGFLLAGFVPEAQPFLLGLVVLTNLGIVCTRPATALEFLRLDVVKFVMLGLAIVCVYTCVFAGMQTLPGQLDLDGEHQGTAYGLIHEFKPYLTSDIIASPYYFAHPTMTNLFNAYSTLLLGRLDDYRYFYDLAKQTERVLNLRPGQDMPIRLGEESGTLLCLGAQTFVFTTMLENDMVHRPFSRQRLVEYMAIRDQNLFFENPQPYPARASNVFASLLVLYVLFQLITKLTDSRLLGIVGGFVYIFSPGIFIRSCMSEHVAFTNMLLVILTYQFCFPREFAGKGKWGGYLKYVPGLMAGLINQKMIIMVLPLFMLQTYSCFRAGEKGSFLRRLVNAAPIPVGFAAGMLVFWGYALFVDPGAFFLSHLRVHLFDRLLHVNTMFAGDYPGVGQLWYEFNYEFPPFLITIFALLYGLKDCRDRTMIFLVMWVISGALFFSAVDWKQTNHLSQLTIPLLIIIMIYIEKQGMTYKRALKILVGLCLLYGFWFDMQLLQNFHFYEPTSGW